MKTGLLFLLLSFIMLPGCKRSPSVTIPFPPNIASISPASGTSSKIILTTMGGIATGPVFTYIVVPPSATVTAISPASGAAGITVTITGTNFKTNTTDNTVKFNRATAAVQTAGAVTVTTADGNATGPVFTYVASPDVYVAGKSPARWGYWKNGSFTAMPSNCAVARSVFVSGTGVYAAGYDLVNGSGSLGRCWKNGVPMTITLSSGNISAGLPVL